MEEWTEAYGIQYELDDAPEELPFDHEPPQEEYGDVPSPPPRAPPDPLDEITVARTVNIGRVARDMNRIGHPDAGLMQALARGEMVDFIGLRNPRMERRRGVEAGRPAEAPLRPRDVEPQNPPTPTHPRWSVHAAQLASPAAGRPVLVHPGTLVVLAWLVYFAVPKHGAPPVMRAIGDARATNARLAPPPRTSLVAVRTLLAILAFFADPWFAEADLRHWFWQIPVNGDDRAWFGMQVLGAVYVFAALCMGFAWAPYIAQAVATQLARRGEKYVVHGDGFITIKRRKHSTLHIVAFIIVYYDNFLVVAGDETIRNELYLKLVINADHYSATWKPANGTFRLTRATGIFVGLCFMSTNHSVLWCHPQDTIDRWSALGPITTASSARDVLRRTGAIVWDMAMRLGTRRTHLRPIQAAYALAAKWGHAQSWNSAPGLSEDMAQAVNQHWSAVLKNPVEALTRVELEGCIHIAIASDASDVGAGIVAIDLGKQRDHKVLLSCTSPTHPGADPILQMHHWLTMAIHVRELRTGLLAIATAAKTVSQRAVIWLAIDNTVAQAGIDAEMLNDEELDDLFDILEQLRRKGISVRTVRTRSKEMPADAASRGITYLDTDSLNRCNVFRDRVLALIEATATDDPALPPGILAKRRRTDETQRSVTVSDEQNGPTP
jgi:hypothetical protein